MWPEHVNQIISADTLQENEVISWAAFHANLQIAASPQGMSHTSLLPLFQDEAKTVTMIRHAMNIVSSSSSPPSKSGSCYSL